MAIALSIATILTVLGLSRNATSELEAYDPPEPYFANLQGDTITTANAGQQIMIEYYFINQLPEPTDYLAIIDVQDSQGVNIFIAWQNNTMPAYGISPFSASWSTKEPGDYRVRVLAVTGLVEPQLISRVRESMITIT